MKRIFFFTFTLLSLVSCKNRKDPNNLIQGKIEREQISLVSKIPGRITEIRTQEGAMVHKGDTLIVLDVPEVDAKKNQAKGAVYSAQAQYEMALKGATNNQIKQLEAKELALREQYEFAQKSLNRLSNMLKDSLVSQQKYDETFAKYQGAQAQYLAVQAEILDVKNGVRIEQQEMALGQKKQALGALQEVSVAESERYILATQDMLVESITLKEGELALPGYALINGTLSNTTYFRFTLPESRLSAIQKGQEIEVNVVYNNLKIKGVVTQVKALGAYAKIATAYPDYEMQESLFEIIIKPVDVSKAKDLFAKTSVTITL